MSREDWKATVQVLLDVPRDSGPKKIGILTMIVSAELLQSPVKALVSGCTAVACGAEFTMWLCEGKLYSAGCPQYGQLGHGTDHEYNAKDCASPHALLLVLQMHLSSAWLLECLLSGVSGSPTKLLDISPSVACALGRLAFVRACSLHLDLGLLGSVSLSSLPSVPTFDAAHSICGQPCSCAFEPGCTLSLAALHGGIGSECMLRLVKWQECHKEQDDSVHVVIGAVV